MSRPLPPPVRIASIRTVLALAALDIIIASPSKAESDRVVAWLSKHFKLCDQEMSTERWSRSSSVKTGIMILKSPLPQIKREASDWRCVNPSCLSTLLSSIRLLTQPVFFLLMVVAVHWLDVRAGCLCMRAVNDLREPFDNLALFSPSLANSGMY